MALGGEIVDFVRLGLLDDADQIGRIGHVAVVEEERHAGFMRIMEQMIDPFRVERGGAPFGAVDRIAFGEEKFGKIGAVLPGDSCDESDFHI